MDATGLFGGHALTKELFAALRFTFSQQMLPPAASRHPEVMPQVMAVECVPDLVQLPEGAGIQIDFSSIDLPCSDPDMNMKVRRIGMKEECSAGAWQRTAKPLLRQVQRSLRSDGRAFYSAFETEERPVMGSGPSPRLMPLDLLEGVLPGIAAEPPHRIRIIKIVRTGRSGSGRRKRRKVDQTHALLTVCHGLLPGDIAQVAYRGARRGAAHGKATERPSAPRCAVSGIFLKVGHLSFVFILSIGIIRAVRRCASEFLRRERTAGQRFPPDAAGDDPALSPNY